MTPAEIEQLVAAELAGVRDAGRRAALQQVLVEPVAEDRSSLHVDGTCTCWIVARDSSTNVLVYCRGPFADPWGCLDRDGVDLGLDSQWFAKLDDAFISAMWDGPLPPSYEVE